MFLKMIQKLKQNTLSDIAFVCEFGVLKFILVLGLIGGVLAALSEIEIRFGGKLIVALILLAIYIIVVRALGLFVTLGSAFKNDSVTAILSPEEQTAVKPGIRWEDILCPFLDTDLPAERARAIVALQKSGLKIWQIKGLRAAVGLGFLMSFFDEWMEFTYEDLIVRWVMALFLDAVVSLLVFALAPMLGKFLMAIWCAEVLVFASLLLFNFYRIKRP